MSGGPPHHPHGRPLPSANPAWNHLQVPNYFPSRQPQHAHMSNDHSILHSHTWHTPTTEPLTKSIPHSHLFSLEQMLADRTYPTRHVPGVDLSVTRNGSQNGDIPTTPISLSVRDTNKINSLPPSALDVQAVELTKCPSPGMKPLSPGVMKPLSPGIKPLSPAGLKSSSPGLLSFSPGLKSSSPGLKCSSPGLSVPAIPAGFATGSDLTKNKRSNKRVDSILERLNPTIDKSVTLAAEQIVSPEKPQLEVTELAQPVLIQTADESSNSSVVNTSVSTKEEDVLSPASNEDSLDSNKSRRKRKPCKTVRVSKEDEKFVDSDNDFSKTIEESNAETAVVLKQNVPEETTKLSVIEEDKEVAVDVPENTQAGEQIVAEPATIRRKTSSESETIDNIAAMVQEGLKEKTTLKVQETEVDVKKEQTNTSAQPVSVVSVIKSNNNDVKDASEVFQDSTVSESKGAAVTAAQKKSCSTDFVEVENKLEEMFAGIEDVDPLKPELPLTDDSKLEDSLLKLVNCPSTSSNEKDGKTALKKAGKQNKPKGSRRSSEVGAPETTPKKKKIGKKSKSPDSKFKKNKIKKVAGSKIEPVKDIYAYDSGSNASSNKSKGPFIHIRGPRDSPISVNVVNTPTHDDDPEKKTGKTKKYHDDSEYRHKVRSKGLHSSTLSNKYDAQTRDVSWICAFCKRGPHLSNASDSFPRNNVNASGDLFGPYFISTNCSEYNLKLEDPYDRQFKSRKITKVLDGLSAHPLKVTGKKTKRKYSETVENRCTDEGDIYLGITDTGNKTFEVWVHEDCITWSAGVHLVGSKIVGLEEAIWTSCNILCGSCNVKGANVCCIKRGCLKTIHICCARNSDWVLDEEQYRAYCPEHFNP